MKRAYLVVGLKHALASTDEDELLSVSSRRSRVATHAGYKLLALQQSFQLCLRSHLKLVCRLLGLFDLVHFLNLGRTQENSRSKPVLSVSVCLRDSHVGIQPDAPLLRDGFDLRHVLNEEGTPERRVVFPELLSFSDVQAVVENDLPLATGDTPEAHQLRLSLLPGVRPDQDVTRMRVTVDESPRECHGTVQGNGEVHDLAKIKTPCLELLFIREPRG